MCGVSAPAPSSPAVGSGGFSGPAITAEGGAHVKAETGTHVKASFPVEENGSHTTARVGRDRHRDAVRWVRAALPGLGPPAQDAEHRAATI